MERTRSKLPDVVLEESEAEKALADNFQRGSASHALVRIGVRLNQGHVWKKNKQKERKKRKRVLHLNLLLVRA